MLILGIFGGICLILGVIFMMDKKDLKKMEEILNKPIIASGDAIKHNKALGAVLLIMAAVLLYLAWTLKN